MKNFFNLRMRRKRLFAGATLLAALLLTPLIQAASGAGVALDVAYGSRLVTGTGSPTDFAGTTSVQQGNVVQFAALVHNTEDFRTGDKARNFRITFTIPKKAATSVTSTAKVTASNGVSRAPYKTTDPATLVSANGAVFNVNNIRNVQFQDNKVAPTNNPTFNWGPLMNIPNSRIQTAHTADAFVFTVQPTVSGDLPASFQDAKRIIFLADIQQAPHLTIDKEVRKAGDANFVDGPIPAPRKADVEYQIEIKNTGKARATDVIVRDALPPNVSMVSGSCRMVVGGTPGVQNCGDLIVRGGMKFTFMNPNSNIFIKFTAKTDQVTDNVEWVRNAAMVRSNETPEVNDTARVDFPAVTPPPTTPPPTTPPPTTPPPTTPPPTTPPPTPGPKQGKLLIVKFEDVNGNGQEDPGEPRLGGVTFFVGMLGTDLGDDTDTPTPEPTATTSADGDGPTGPGAASEHVTDNSGEILLSDLELGTYRAEEQVPSGFNPTTATVQQTDVVEEGTAVLKFGNQRFQKKVVPKPVPPQAQVKGALPVTGTPGAAMLALAAIAGSTYLYRRERTALRKTIRNQSVKG